MWGLRSSRTGVMLAAALTFVVVCVLPSFYMLLAIVRSHDVMVTLRTALLDSRQQSLLYTTILLGLGTAALATIVGAALGVVLARIALPFKPAVRVALSAPAVLPPYVVALAFTYIGGGLSFTLAGAIVVLAVVFYPLAMLATEVGLRRIDPRVEEAALMVTTPARVLRRISWPLIQPTVISAALVIFVLAVSEFSVPGLLRVRVFTTEVFTAFAAFYDFGRATALSVPLLITSTIVAGGAAVALSHRFITSTRFLAGPSVDAFDMWKPAGVAIVGAAIVAMLGVPIAALVAEARWSASLLPAVLNSREAAINSVILALVGATAVTVLATCLGYARSRATTKVGAACDAFWMVLFTVPSTVVGIALIGIWNRSGALGAVYGTAVMLVLGYLARFLPAAALAVGAIMRSIPSSHEEAAAAAGAGWLRTMIHIVLPQVRTGLVAVWVVAFVLAFGEVGTSILVAPTGESTLPIRVYTLTANAPPGHVAALALLQSVVVLIPLTLLATASARRSAR